MKAMKTAVFAALAFAFSVETFALGTAIPPKVAAQLRKYTPAALSPVPKSVYGKITPFKSQTRRYPENKYSVETGSEPFVLVSLSDDAKAVELRVADGFGGYTNRWFGSEDAFGPVKWNLEKFVLPCRHLAYHMFKKNTLELFASIPEGTVCASLGTVHAGIRKIPHRLVLLRRSSRAAGMSCEFTIAILRSAPPVKTKAEYDRRAEELMAEHAYRNGREWGKMHPAILTNEGCFECAGMASDFKCYMFDGGLKTGEMFTDPSEIRAGDTVYMKSHYFAVVQRHGEKLVTIEGNMNKKVCQSSKRYSVRGGELYCGKEKREFVRGWHGFMPGGGASSAGKSKDVGKK